MSDTPKPDMWDYSGAFWHRDLPSETIRQFVTGEERPMMTIAEERGKYWLGDNRHGGQSPFDSLQAAKDAGDARHDELYAVEGRTLAQDAGLAPDEWTFRHAPTGDYVWFEKAGEAETIITREGARKWTLTIEGAEVEGVTYATAKAAAEDLDQRRAFAPVI